MTKADRENSTSKEAAETDDFTGELQESRWSVISFEKCEAGNLTYLQAERKLAELQDKKVSGLCIVTDEAAARI